MRNNTATHYSVMVHHLAFIINQQIISVEYGQNNMNKYMNMY